LAQPLSGGGRIIAQELSIATVRASTKSAEAARDLTEPRWLTPRHLFLLLGLAFAVIVVAFRGQILWLEREHLLEQRRAQATTLVRFGASYTARIYDASSRLATEVADHVRTDNPDPEQLAAFLRSRTQNTTVNAYAVVLDKTGKLVASSEPAPRGRDFGGAGYVERVSTANRRVETVLRSSLTGAVIYPLAQTLVDRSGAFAGVVGINARPDGIRPTAARRPEDPQLSVWGLDGRFIAAAFVDFDANGRPIIPPKPGGVGLPNAPSRPAAGVIQASGPVEGWPLMIVASYDQSGVLAVWRQHVWENVGLVALLLAGVAALVWLGLMTARREEVAKANYLLAQQAAVGALHDRELLLKEIHHRIKNSLFLTSSLIHLQGRRFRDPEVRAAFESTQRRLSSIGLVHDALYSGQDFGEVDLSAYLPKLVEEAAAGYGAEARRIGVDVDVDPIRIPADRATSVALILTEVLTNAFKYAFSDRAHGRLSVVGRRADEEATITVQDDGPGFEQADLDASGLGTRLIRSLSDQIGGHFKFEHADGARFVLVFPVEALKKVSPPEID
jgi:two-component sensor histidine kinase